MLIHPAIYQFPAAGNLGAEISSVYASIPGTRDRAPRCGMRDHARAGSRGRRAGRGHVPVPAKALTKSSQGCASRQRHDTVTSGANANVRGRSGTVLRVRQRRPGRDPGGRCACILQRRQLSTVQSSVSVHVVTPEPDWHTPPPHRVVQLTDVAVVTRPPRAPRIGSRSS